MLTTLSQLLENDANVKFAYLFGSYAEGTQRDESDVDLAVYLRDASLDARLALHHRLERVLAKSVDLVVLNEAKNIYLLEAILRKGIVVADDESREDFELRKGHEIIDFKNFRRYIDAA